MDRAHRPVRRRRLRSTRTQSSWPPGSLPPAGRPTGLRRADTAAASTTAPPRPSPSECEDEDVYVIGGANSAGQAAMFLSREAKSVTIVVRAPSLEASMSYYLIQQIETNPNITVRTCTEVHGALGEDDHLDELTLEDNQTGADRRRHLRPDVHLHRRRAAHRLARRRARPRRPRLHPDRPRPAQRRAAGPWTAHRTTWKPACRVCSSPATCAPSPRNGSPPRSAKDRWP